MKHKTLFLLVICLPILLGWHSVLSSGCPANMVSVQGHASCIDKYEWPNRPGEKPWFALSGEAEQRDLENGKVFDIERLCASVGKRPCNRSEWIAACRGKRGAKYPWGNDIPVYTPGLNELPCNADKSYVAIESEQLVYLRDPVELSRVEQLEPSGSRQACVSASGMMDAIGQVEEWVRCDRKFGWCLMGGHFAGPKSCDDTIAGHAPKWHYPTTGGRCCLDKEY